jgi:hypothetical protein
MEFNRRDFLTIPAFKAYCPFLLLCDEIIPAQMAAAPGQIEAERILDEALFKAEELRSIEDVGQFEWPSDIMKPTASPKTVEGRAIVDLVKIAAAYVFLHEVRHHNSARIVCGPTRTSLSASLCNIPRRLSAARYIPSCRISSTTSVPRCS